MLEMPSSSTEFPDAVVALGLLVQAGCFEFSVFISFPSLSNAVRNPVISHCLAMTAIMDLAGETKDGEALTLHLRSLHCLYRF